jgi:sugar O-acyltransferase (sialic acid O-acetyltransferase NeuD family)
MGEGADERTQVVILGAGGTGLDALEIIEAVNAAGGNYECLGFLDDDERHWGHEIGGLRIIGPLSLARDMPRVRFVHAIGSSRNFRQRVDIVERLALEPERFESLVHPSAAVSPRCRLGRGAIICPNVYLGAGSRIGNGVTILANAAIHHGAEVGDWTLVAGGANVASDVRIGPSCYVGAGATVKERLEIGSQALVGMGAVVIRDVPAQAVVVGNPAHEIPGSTSASDGLP